MIIDDIVNIIDGELVNSGYISEIKGFANNLKKVKRESLFISNNLDEIKEAIKKGAYAILFSEDINIIDDEIAWIKVENINKALLNILKYKLLNKTLYFCNNITLSIIESINKDNIAIIKDDNFVEYLEGDYVFVTSLGTLLNISSNVFILKDKKEIKLLKSTTFISNFIYKENKYSIQFPKLYMEELEIALAFLENNNLKYNLKSLKLDRFIPIFINSKYEKVKYGKSQKVLITKLKNDNFLMRELDYIFENLKYAKVKFYNANNIDKIYKDKYNFAVLIDCEIELNEKQSQTNKLF